LFAKLSLDKTDYEKGLDDAKTKGKELLQVQLNILQL
jgi:hypothetical protein